MNDALERISQAVDSIEGLALAIRQNLDDQNCQAGPFDNGHGRLY